MYDPTHICIYNSRRSTILFRLHNTKSLCISFLLITFSILDDNQHEFFI